MHRRPVSDTFNPLYNGGNGAHLVIIPVCEAETALRILKELPHYRGWAVELDAKDRPITRITEN